MGHTSEEVEAMPSVFATWMEQPIVLQVAAGELRVPLRGTIVGETEDALRFRVCKTWDIGVLKSMVLAVEEVQLEESIT
jgi:hypothetical protein